MMYKAKVAVCSEIPTKHSTQSERHVEFLNATPGGSTGSPKFQKVNHMNTRFQSFQNSNPLSSGH